MIETERYWGFAEDVATGIPDQWQNFRAGPQEAAAEWMTFEHRNPESLGGEGALPPQGTVLHVKVKNNSHQRMRVARYLARYESTDVNQEVFPIGCYALVGSSPVATALLLPDTVTEATLERVQIFARESRLVKGKNEPWREEGTGAKFYRPWREASTAKNPDRRRWNVWVIEFAAGDVKKDKVFIMHHRQ